MAAYEDNVLPMRKPRAVVDPVVSREEQEEVADINRRLVLAEEDYNRHKARIDDCYTYALPWRHKAGQTRSVDQLNDIYDDTAMTVVEDFAADMLNVFTPMKAAWIEIKAAEVLEDAGDRALIEPMLEQYLTVLFGEMRKSNLYQALQECYLDLAVGTMAMSITDINKAQPIHCEAIPAGSELLLERGPYGMISGIWRKQCLKGETIMVVWPDAKKLTAECWEGNDKTNTYDITDGIYRDWSVPATERWCYVVMCNNRLIFEADYTGSGSCQMIVARWSRDSTTAWGVGPLYRTTPSVKGLNYMQNKFMKLFDKTVDPPVSYEDDSVMNIEHGVEPGMWIPRLPGSQAPQAIESQNRFDFGYVQRDDLIHNIKRAHYQDRPEQAGKTPPTATQWSDEAAERARRMGTPATNLVHEWQYAIVARFAYLLAKRGKLPKIELNGKDIALEPVSPMLRAQEQEEVVRMDRYAEMITARFGPQMANVIIKVPDYALVLAKKMGIPANLVNGPAEIKAAIAQFGQLAAQAQATQVSPQAPGGVPV